MTIDECLVADCALQGFDGGIGQGPFLESHGELFGNDGDSLHIVR